MMDPADAAWVRANVLEPKFGRQLTQPVYIGQTEYLHLTRSVCHGCVLGYHGGCSGWSWPRIPETWIADHSGSTLWWAHGSRYLVWAPPRRCECTCPQQTTQRPALALSVPKAESRPPAAAPIYEQPDLFTNA